MFNKKSKQIQNLKKSNNNLVKKQKENIEDFILILNQIQDVINSKEQWKCKTLSINNSIDLAKENYIQKIVELEIDPQY